MSEWSGSAARHLGSLLGALFLAILLPGAAAAQGLGDAAGRERERRQSRPQASPKVFTNDDLPSRESSEDAEEGEAEDDEDAPELDKVGAVDPLRAQLDREREERALQEREWRARFREARARVREEEARCWQEVVRTEFYQGVPVQMKVQEFVESEAFRQARQDLADLEEEFRRTSHPPGWARE